jgi:hypothetical protein
MARRDADMVKPEEETFYACRFHQCALSFEEAAFLVSLIADCPICGCCLGGHVEV